MSSECGEMKEAAVKVEPPDSSSLDAASTVKTEPADDVYSLEEETIVKEELEIGPIVIRPPDLVYMSQPCKREAVEDTPAGTSYSVQSQDESTSEKSYSAISDQVDARTASVDDSGDMKVVPVKVEPPDSSSLDAASTVKTEPADDVYSLEEETIVKEELEIGPIVIRPPDLVYMSQPCKREAVEDTPAGTSYSVQSQDESTSEKSYPAISDQVDARTASEDNNRPHRCNTCNRYFKSSRLLKIHTSTHVRGRPYICEICNKCFKRRRHFMTHMKSHTCELPFICEVCNKGFKVRVNLLKHMKTHTSERPFNCEVCNKRFRIINALNVHIRTHTGELPYNCKVCNKLFNTSGDLKRHSRTHTGERPYNCEVCNKRFKTNTALKRHSRCHTRATI